MLGVLNDEVDRSRSLGDRGTIGSVGMCSVIGCKDDVVGRDVVGNVSVQRFLYDEVDAKSSIVGNMGMYCGGRSKYDVVDGDVVGSMSMDSSRHHQVGDGVQRRCFGNLSVSSIGDNEVDRGRNLGERGLL